MMVECEIQMRMMGSIILMKGWDYVECILQFIEMALKSYHSWNIWDILRH